MFKVGNIVRFSENHETCSRCKTGSGRTCSFSGEYKVYVDREKLNLETFYSVGVWDHDGFCWHPEDYLELVRRR